MRQPMTGFHTIMTALARGDYARAEVAAAAFAPGKEAQLHQFRIQMESYERARIEADWYKALRALADARMAAIGSGIPTLEEVVTDRLRETIRLYEGRRS